MGRPYFFQILLSGQDEPQPIVPKILADLSREFQSLYPESEYYLLQDLQIVEFLKSTFKRSVLDSYLKLVPLAFRADLARYCLIYKFGGWYSDISLKPVFRYNLPDHVEFLYFCDHGDGASRQRVSPMDCQNGMFYAKKGHPVLARSIQSVINNCRHEYYGLTSLSPTGPSMFGRHIANYVPNLKASHGVFAPLTPSNKNINRAYIAPDGTLMALHKSSWHNMNPGGGDFSSMGMKQTNNYNELWREKRIYTPSSSV